MVNVMGDALATGIMAHICRKDFVKEGEQVRVHPVTGLLRLPQPVYASVTHLFKRQDVDED